MEVPSAGTTDHRTPPSARCSTASGSSPTAPDSARTPDRGSFRQRLLLKGAVGEAGHNDPDDEATVRHGLALLGHLPLGAIVPGNRLEPSALGDGIARLLRRHGRPPARTLTPGSPAAATLTKELGIAYADKLPEEAPPHGPVAAQDGRGGKPRPLAEKGSEDAIGDRPNAAYWGTYGSEPVLGAQSTQELLDAAKRETGIAIPEEKNQLPMLVYNWAPFYGALKDAGLGPDARFAMMQSFAWEGGLTRHIDEKTDEILAVAGIQNGNLGTYRKEAGLPSGVRVEELTNKQRVDFYEAYFGWKYSAYEKTGGLSTLDKVGDAEIAAAIGDTLIRGGGPSIADAIQKSVNQVLASHPELAASLDEARRGNGGPNRPGSKAARIGTDGIFGPDTLRALQTIAKSRTGKAALLNAIADGRLDYHARHPKEFGGAPEQGDLDRYDYFRFQ